MKEFNIGDKVFWATHKCIPVKKTCPVCYGKLEVTLILGNGDNVKTPCDFCKRGFSEPYGYVEVYEYVSDVKEVKITGKEVVENEKGKRVEYSYENYCLDNKNAFETKEEAESRVLEMIREKEVSEINRDLESSKSRLKKYTWNIGYYKREIKNAEKNIDRYNRLIKVCDELLTTPITT